VAADAAGNVFIADYTSARIRKVSTDGIITTIAGGSKGYSGDGGPASDASITAPLGIAVDGAGNASSGLVASTYSCMAIGRPAKPLNVIRQNWQCWSRRAASIDQLPVRSRSLGKSPREFSQNALFPQS
jgi:hypothetical protein